MSDPKPHDCPHCDSPGGQKTYQHQVCMPIHLKVQHIDYCIHRLVAALNAGGVGTVASCCGHRQDYGTITLDDGRWLTITDGEPPWLTKG